MITKNAQHLHGLVEAARRAQQEERKMPPVDVLIQNEGTIFTFCPQTATAKAWIDANVNFDGWQWLSGALCCEHRFARDLIHGMLEDGLVLA
jgi:hypothetical protein